MNTKCIQIIKDFYLYLCVVDDDYDDVFLGGVKVWGRGSVLVVMWHPNYDTEFYPCKTLISTLENYLSYIQYRYGSVLNLN